MSETEGAGAASGGNEGAVAAAAAGAAGAAAPTGTESGASGAAAGSQVLSGAASAASATDGDAGKPAVQDWAARRASIVESLPAELRERAQKKLERYASDADVTKALLSSESKITELAGRVKVPTGKGDDPADVEAYRKAVGVPEAPDKYAIPEVKGVQWSDEQKGEIGEFFKAAHAMNMSQAQAEAALTVLAQSNARAQMAFQEQGKARAQAVQEDLRAEYGRDYLPNMELANRWVKEQFAPHAGENGVGEFMNARLADGTHLGENLTFVRWAVSNAIQAADHGVLETGDGKSGVGLDERLNELYAMKTKDSKGYGSAAIQDELMKLEGIRMKRDAAKAAR
jgi:hypothetical protein